MARFDSGVACAGREDRAAVFSYPEGRVVVVADGAGGTGSGARAAEAVLEAVRRAGWKAEREDWVQVLEQVDARGGPGQSTALVVALGGHGLCGACVGDSEAWWFPAGSGTECVELTRGQQRKPLLGSGGARVVGFAIAAPAAGRLVVGADGLWKYVPWERIVEATVQGGGSAAERAERLLESARMPSGGLQDDVGVVVCDVGEE